MAETKAVCGRMQHMAAQSYTDSLYVSISPFFSAAARVQRQRQEVG